METLLELTVTLHSVSCGSCGGVYAINNSYRDKCYKEGLSWTCPYCKCGWGWGGKGENQILREQLAAKEAALTMERAHKAAALTRANVAEVAKTKLEREATRGKTRAAAGVCPCCPRTFVNLRRHLSTKHPEYVSSAGVSITKTIKEKK